MGQGVVAFAVVAALLVMTLGPDFAVVLPSALRSRRAGFSTALGTASGLTVHALAATFGVSLLLESSAVAFTVVKLAGAAVLCVLGGRALWAARRNGAVAAVAAPEVVPGAGVRSAYRRGFLANVLNPKAPIIYLSVMPEFLDPDVPATPQLAVMSLTLVTIALTWYVLLTVLVHRLRNPIARARHWIERATGVVLIALGVRLVFDQRP